MQERPSLQTRGDPLHAPVAEHTSPTVQKRPSAQLTPVRAVHAVVLTEGLHSWHALPGSTAPSA